MVVCYAHIMADISIAQIGEKGNIIMNFVNYFTVL